MIKLAGNLQGGRDPADAGRDLLDRLKAPNAPGDDLRETGEPEVLEYFDEVQHDVVENAGDFMTVEPGGALRSEPHAPGAREHLTVLEGELLVEVAGSRTALTAGETLRYAADRNHAIVNTQDAAARALLVVQFEG